MVPAQDIVVAKGHANPGRKQATDGGRTRQKLEISV